MIKPLLTKLSHSLEEDTYHILYCICIHIFALATDAIHIHVCVYIYIYIYMCVCVIFYICFQVIICTDGQANIGLGQLDQESSHWPAPSPYFYNQLAHYAAEKG